MINTEIIGEMDPYIIIEHNKLKNFRTKTCDEAGKNPVWNEEFLISLTSPTDTINLLCYDEDIIVDDFIGVATLNIDLTKPSRDF